MTTRRIGSRRRFLVAGVLGAMLSCAAFAQKRTVKIGILSPRSLRTSFLTPPLVQRLAELGYREGSGMVLEYRSADDKIERFSRLARELIDARCDIIFAVGPLAAVTALRDARVNAPVVFYANEYDPVASGIVATLARPEGNFTGVYVSQNALVAKRLELMRETVPSVRHFLALSDSFSRAQLGAARKAAEALGLRFTAVEFFEQPYDFAGAFERGRQAQVDAFLLLSSPTFATHFGTLLALVHNHRLPAVGAVVFSERGLLLGYGPHAANGARRVAELGARILKGAKPSDVPVEQDDNFELVINAKAAKALGVNLPESVRARAVRIVS
jgi:putative tryptophan/tyrosine transport system substrate-binding protein